MSEATGRRFRAPATPSNARAVAVFIVAGVVAALGNALFQRICASRVSLDDIGAFNALLAVVGGVGVLGLGMQVVVGRLPDGAFVPWLLSVGAGGVVGVLVGVGMPVSGWYAVAVGGLMGAITTATFCGVAARARLLQQANWVRLAAIYVIGAAVRLAVLPAMLALIDKRLVAALATTFVAEVAMTLVAVLLAPRRAVAAPHYDRAAIRGLLRAVVVLGGLWALTVLDTVLARLRLSARGADAYSLGTTVARASFFMALLLTHLALPTFVRQRGRSQRMRDVFASAMLAIGLGASTVAVVVVAAPTWVAHTLLGGDAGVVDVSTLRLLAAGWAAMSVVPLLTYFHLDRHPRLAMLPAGAAVVLVVAGLMVRTNDALAVVTAVVFTLCMAAMVLPALQRMAPVTRSVSWQSASLATAATGGSRDVAMVVPFYNPGGAALVDTVSRLVTTLTELGYTSRVVAVSDGSTDGSVEALQAAGLPGVEVVVLPANRGKGAALRAGLARSVGTYVGYIDADGDLPPEQLSRFLAIATSSGADAVVGSKVHADSDLALQRHRTAMSVMFRFMVRVLFRLDVRDTQTGLKLYRGDVVGPLVSRLREDGFAIDVEILVAARRDRTLSIVEAPVDIIASAGSTVSWRRAIATGGGLCRIFWRNHVALLYDPSADAAPPPVTELSA